MKCPSGLIPGKWEGIHWPVMHDRIFGSMLSFRQFHP